MTGIAAAIAGNGIGVAGTCPACHILPIKAANSQGFLSSYDVFQALEYAVNDHTIEGIPENPNPADIISMSFVFGASNSYLASGIGNASAAGAILVAAAGNHGSSTLRWPAAYPEVIAVTATDENDAKTSISTYGSWVDIAAPGISIWTTTYQNTYTTSTGTSASTAMVSGLLGLMKSRNPSLDQNRSLHILQATAAPVSGFPEIGGGRIDAYHAVLRSRTPRLWYIEATYI